MEYRRITLMYTDRNYKTIRSFQSPIFIEDNPLDKNNAIKGLNRRLLAANLHDWNLIDIIIDRVPSPMESSQT